MDEISDFYNCKIQKFSEIFMRKLNFKQDSYPVSKSKNSEKQEHRFL